MTSSRSGVRRKADFLDKDAGFAKRCENLFACIQYFSICLVAAEKVLWPIICRLSGNNRPITDYLKNGRLIGFADYLPINRLIPKMIHKKDY
jgi:hypothetical protein